MPFNRLSNVLRREAPMPTLATAEPAGRSSFVMWPFALTQGPWQEIYRIAHEKAKSLVLPEPALRVLELKKKHPAPA